MNALFVNVKRGDTSLKVRLNENTSQVLSRVFKLNADSIYLIGDESVLMPDPRTGEFNPDDVLSFITYEVFGDPQQQDIAAEPSCSYLQPTVSAGRRLNPNPPPGVSGNMARQQGLTRPAFMFAKTQLQHHGSASSSPGSSPARTWRKTVIFCEVVDGKPSPIFQVYLNLCEETATVEQVAKQVENEVGTPVILLDNKYLQIRTSNATKGSFWQGCRKVFAIPSHCSDTLLGKRKAEERKAEDQSSDIISELKKMRNDLVKVQEAAGMAISNQSNNQIAIEDEASVCRFLEKVFKCNICFSVATLPVAACAGCENVIGCIPCVEQWREAGSICPLCRCEDDYVKVPMVRNIQQLLTDIAVKPSHGQPRVQTATVLVASSHNNNDILDI